MNEQVLLFHFPEEALASIRIACLICGVTPRVIDPVDDCRAIGELAGIPGIKPQPSLITQLDAPMMVLCMPQGRLDGFLTALRGAGVQAPFKAMLTPTNQNWTAPALLAELKREQAAFAKMNVKRK